MKDKFTVSWTETDSFSGKQKQAYRDFKSAAMAYTFAATIPHSKVELIADAPWHHAHASTSKANAGTTD